MKHAAVFKIVLVLAAGLMILGCSKNPASIVGATTSQTTVSIAKAAPFDFVNCLSMPVVWAEGHGLTGEDCTHFTGLRGTYGEENFVEPFDATLIDGLPVYRNPSVNEWQAESVDGTTLGGEIGVELDWADNLTRQTWTDKSKVRVEIVLFEELATPLKGYNMFSLGGTQLDEVFVTNTTTYAATVATVYSNVARLKIEKLDADGGLPLEVYNSAVCDKYFVDGRLDAYSAEVNMAGKCIYGFNWNVRDVSVTDRSGWYRLTFSLDKEAKYTDYDGNEHTVYRNTKLNNLNPLDLIDNNPVVVYQPTLADDGCSSTLDIYIKSGSGSAHNSASTQ